MEDKLYFFERNLLALDREKSVLCERLSSARTTKKRYRMLDSRTGCVVPSIEDKSGRAHPLHSLFDPEKEAARFCEALNEGFLIFFGLGGGYFIEAALKNKNTESVLIIDYDIDGAAELLSSKDYVNIFNDKRVTLLIDAAPTEIKDIILKTYKPLLHNNLRAIPLRARCDFEKEKFARALSAVNDAIETISLDYSVQAQFGKRWFSNIMHNITSIENISFMLPPVNRAVIFAAGPSLDNYIDEIKKNHADDFLIAVDTSLHTLLYNDIIPDVALSIDCQHISYRHFKNTSNKKIKFFFSVSSPPLLRNINSNYYFFCDAHPLSIFINKYYKELPVVDTKGGNVTYAALSFASLLNAKEIYVYGADFSYPEGKTYTRGAYIYPFFDKGQNRFSTKENLFSSFMFRSPSLSKKNEAGSWRYQTPSLSMYKNTFLDLAANIDARVFMKDANGKTLEVESKNKTKNNIFPMFACGAKKMSAADFIKFYFDVIESLPDNFSASRDYIESLSPLQGEVFLTLLPLLSHYAFKAGCARNDFAELLRMLKTTLK